MLDLGALLAETRESPPSGPNLEHDLSFFELEEAARGKEERRVGDAAIPAEEPKWPKVVELAQGLLVRSKDLRVAVYLTRALTRTEGIPGLATGVGLMHGLLERYWDSVHPVLDAESDNDPTERLNALTPLVDAEAVIKDLRDAYVINSREHGQLQAREVENALGRLASSGAAGAKPIAQVHAQIAAAFAQDQTVPSALREVRERLNAIQALVTERVGAGRAIDLKPLAYPIESLIQTCDAALGTGPASAEGEAATDEGGRVVAKPGEIRSREEAVRMLELVCRFMERHEPSNPAPLFIRRAKRLMEKNFIEIVKDLMPDSLAQLEKLAGEPMDDK